MASVLQPITACLKKAEVSEDKDTSKENNSSSEKNSVTDVSQPSLLWRMSSQVYNIGSGVVGASVGSVKWAASTAASTTYSVGTGVLSATQTVVSKVIPSTVPKPKKE